MKSSRYNHFFDAQGGRIVLGYNSCTGALAEIEKENYPRVRELLSRPDGDQIGQDGEFLQCLREGGFLVSDAVDERAVLRDKAQRLRREGTVLALTIAPTLACNFDCDYCFEGRSGVRMSDETQQALLKFADHHLNRAEHLRVCWFGGEPTLCRSIIDHLQGELLGLAEKHLVDIIPGMIITNGYLFDGALAGHLKNLGIENAQVTIDGPEAVHDRRRKLRNGGGTFRRIMDNLSETVDIMHTTIRINVDRANVDSACEVVEILQRHGILSKVKISFAQVSSSGAACADIRDRCFGEEDFSCTLVDIYRRLIDQGIYQVDYPHVFSGAVYCGALSEGYFTVSPTGYLFKCWEELSLDGQNSVGNVHSLYPDGAQQKRLDAYMKWNPFDMTECRECDILPICMGGCPVRGMKLPGNSRGVCSSWKYNLKEMIELQYLCDIHEEVGRP